jgi:hypothetical protein
VARPFAQIHHRSGIIERLAQLINKYTKIPYWLVFHGIEVWGKLPPVKGHALRGAAKYVALTRFSLDATIVRHALGKPAAVLFHRRLPFACLARPVIPLHLITAAPVFPCNWANYST